MKENHPFEWLGEDGLMVVQAEINGQTTLRFLLDTGSSHTCLDKNVLYIEQIALKNSIGQVEIETANGRILADIFVLPSLEVLGTRVFNHPIQVIDFFEHQILSNYSGVLGMDFLKQKNLCIYFEDEYLTFK